MRTIERPVCPVCGGAGAEQYAALEDRLFGAPGQWRLKRCLRLRCGTLWLDPAPHPDDLWMAYQHYYTHALSPHVAVELVQNEFHEGWAGWRLRYPATLRAFWRGLKLLVQPKEAERAEFFRLYLPWVRAGRLLDVGCGAGNQLRLMQALGWQAEGLDPDPNAVKAANEAGLHVTQGDLLTTKFPDAAFNAVTMVHVMEHLVEPRRHLAECMRILKPGGRLMLITPNARSLGHRRFGASWRGLEPPRHLQIFTLSSLRQLVKDLGFRIQRSHASARDAGYLLLFSERLRSGSGGDAIRVPPGQLPPARLMRAEMIERFIARLGISVGEELVIVARKPKRRQ
jgi:SAM-dependent methyltransferase